MEVALEKIGHHVLFSFMDHKETLWNLNKIIISGKLLRLKEAKLPGMAPEDQMKFISKWKQDHSDILIKQLGNREDNL
jgi:hypothetical protein